MKQKALALFIVMLMIVSSVLFFLGSGGDTDRRQGGRDILIDKPFDSLGDALRLTPNRSIGVSFAQYILLRGIEDTTMGRSLRSSLGSGDNPMYSDDLYGVPLIGAYAALYPDGFWMGLHDVGNNSVSLDQITRIYEYGNLTVREQIMFGFVISTDPIIFGSLPAIVGDRSTVDDVVDSFKGLNNETIYTQFESLMSNVQDDASWSRIGTAEIINNTSQYYVGITSLDNEVYRFSTALRISGTINETEILALKENATDRGLHDYTINISDEYIVATAYGNWFSVVDEFLVFSR